ncbi:MAG: tRNA (adenosine(37)-N6)-threonylcarbamoyltransferase complex dimerization subunit type 1 TsaB [Desulfobacteraceae bacterium]|nr:tRNA (adenosine(37)-N6)-threonylcarbamoyltransferase complex dimerization subunit type 1 TsaB [Desulfobacteraceae bacterium]MDH3723433.1 tRNA (adenosine(37)-N6)-threonylcarbamoyltransferase complex dimerization subunit type 1 TsaB [Desulfobacteraceae bacterium]MDH3873283.1 tRNA (adenosine(37)-N6)-threonylcarbamoyltransferase complex dimerization subunit type 1 TsaB [Desulfobacteraceae bacterium]PLX53718.1 MAG: tRNA (adenosine(37)-N6)-threonylcarbamoyltransferase complex dimerization subunit t
MRILAVDTATTSCSVAIVDKTSLLSEFTIDREETHSKHLMDMIKAVLRMAGLNFSDLDGFAVTRGPGSFTGLRIGLSTIKGLAVASEKPVVGVSSLEALAFQVSYSRDLICPILDARKGEVYFSRYRFLNGHLKKQTKERVAPPDKAVDDLNESCLFVGNGALLYKEMILEKMGGLASIAPMIQNTIRASTMAYLSMAKFEKNDTDDIEKIMPYYIRKSDAELNLMKS